VAESSPVNASDTSTPLGTAPDGDMSMLSICLRMVASDPGNFDFRVALGNRLFETGKFDAAAAHYRKAIELQADHGRASLGLELALKGESGDCQEEVGARQRDLRLDRTQHFLAAKALVERGAAHASFSAWQAAVLADPGCLHELNLLITAALEAGELALAADFAKVDAGLRLGSRWYPPGSGFYLPTLSLRPSEPMLTIPKLRHDIEQFEYLWRCGLVGHEIASVIEAYERAIARLQPIGAEGRTSLTDEDRREIGYVYNRIVHVHDAPRIPHALSTSWDRAAVEERYVEEAPGIVVIDDFLSPEALASLRRFCLESTVWSANHYANGRLGAFFRDGFNCPLMIQVADELRWALPRLIGLRHPLRQLWGFKYQPTLPDDTTHADFAAVNVNFWITPDTANLDAATGGLIVYRSLAPLNWDFNSYNRSSKIIHEFLTRVGASTVTIPYRANRAVIFNSNLFHRTAPLQFRPGYEDRRINITMLYGDREDALHRGPSDSSPDLESRHRG
jgi:hypothetical protein